MKTLNLSLITIGGILLAGAPAKANSLDLTANLGTGVINGAVFTNTDVGSTGTGVIQSFVRLGKSSGFAEGYNGTTPDIMPNVNNSAQFTHNILLSAVPLTPVANQAGLFYEFLLDINQNGSDPLLSLDRLQIYTRAGALASNDEFSDLAGATLRYDIDAAPDGPSEVLLNYNFNNGSGSGDLFVYVPQSVFGATTDNVYLYSMFGAKGGIYEENDGFEEWAVREPGTPSVPDGGTTVALLGMALGGIGMARRLLGKKA